MAEMMSALERWPEHPRPQMKREKWQTLDGAWDLYIDRKAEIRYPGAVSWDRTIQVPFAPETEASGIKDTSFYCAVWYRRNFETPTLSPDERLWLCFEAVDYKASVWINGTKVGTHRGGYTPFSFDVTGHLVPGGPQEVIVRAEDDPADLAKPRGKQDWKLDPHSIWYPRTTGIWQTVWMEVRPAAHIASLQWTSSLERWEIGMDAAVVAPADKPMYVFVRLSVGDQVLAQDQYRVLAGEAHRRIALSDPGIDDYRNGLLWSPHSPTLIDALIQLRDESGAVIDQVQSYTAIRSIAIQGDRFILNGRPLTLRLVLDQGYWPESGTTAPNDAALLRDVLLAKRLGFNGVRKHQKIECARYMYWADKVGLLVWGEMPSAYRYTTQSIHRLTKEWLEVIERDRSHPCIVAWVPFNESWGVPDLPDSPAQRHYVQGLYHLTKALDPTRPVVGNDGWESIATDIVGIHDYDDQPERIGRRYGIDDVESRLFQRERPGGRMLLVGEGRSGGRPIMITEFGGISFNNTRPDAWGYSSTRSSDELLERYTALMETVRSLPALAGFCYTQLTDTYQETNGLLYPDRTPKAPVTEIALATAGMHSDFDAVAEAIWRENIMVKNHER